MSQYGSAQYGTSQYPSSTAEPTHFVIDDRIVELTRISTTYLGHTITFNAGPSIRDHFLQYADQAGKTDRLVLADGGFKTYDRSESGISIGFDPPQSVQPPYTEGTYLIRGYQENPIQTFDRYEITLNLLRETPRESTDSVDQLSESSSTQYGGTQYGTTQYGSGSGSDEYEKWVFGFKNDTVIEDTVQVQAINQNTQYQLNITTDDRDFARAVVENPAYQDGVKDWTVPGGDNFAEDTTDGRNTVTINGSSGYRVQETIPDGTYIIVNWSVGKTGSNEFQIDLSVKKPYQ